MNNSSDNGNLSVVIAIIYFIAGTYSILSVIFALAKVDIKIPGFYQLGVFISNLLFGESKAANFEKEMMDTNKVVRYAILWILMGIIVLGGGVFLIFAK